MPVGGDRTVSTVPSHPELKQRQQDKSHNQNSVPTCVSWSFRKPSQVCCHEKYPLVMALRMASEGQTVAVTTPALHRALLPQ
eukprot:3024572-Amphidinium_carterae.1